jgi:hypothetical protein
MFFMQAWRMEFAFSTAEAEMYNTDTWPEEFENYF